MSTLITKELVQMFENFPLYAQDGESDPIVVAKLFDAYGTQGADKIYISCRED